jgi:hypothetical protein
VFDAQVQINSTTTTIMIKTTMGFLGFEADDHSKQMRQAALIMVFWPRSEDFVKFSRWRRFVI